MSQFYNIYRNSFRTDMSNSELADRRKRAIASHIVPLAITVHHKTIFIFSIKVIGLRLSPVGKGQWLAVVHRHPLALLIDDVGSHPVNLFAHGGEAVLEILARGRDGETTPVQPASLNRAAKVGLNVEDKEPT